MLSIAILPAAGRSTRMGRPKLLLPWGLCTLVEHVLGAWRASRASHTIVVVHPDDRELADVCRRCGAAVVVAPAAPPDMKASVRLGLEWAARQFQPAAADVWLVSPADTPGIAAETIDLVLDSVVADRPEILVPEYQGRRGHPVLFPWPLAGEVAGLAANEGVNSLMARHPVRSVPCSNAGILVDLDTAADYEQWRRGS